jgi:hypothetical protein
MQRAAQLLMTFCAMPILALTAQEPGSVPLGQRVRLKTNAPASSQWLVGTLVAADEGSLRLRVAVSLGRADVTLSPRGAGLALSLAF